MGRARPDRTYKALVTHALLLGIAWFPITCAGFASLGTRQYDDWLTWLPNELRGIIIVLVVLSALPLLWPLYMALAFVELRLAGRLRGAVPHAARQASYLLLLQAVAWAIPAIWLVLLAIQRSRHGGDLLTWMWAVPTSLVLIDLLIARALWRYPSRHLLSKVANR